MKICDAFVLTFIYPSFVINSVSDIINSNHIFWTYTYKYKKNAILKIIMIIIGIVYNHIAFKTIYHSSKNTYFLKKTMTTTDAIVTRITKTRTPMIMPAITGPDKPVSFSVVSSCITPFSIAISSTPQHDWSRDVMLDSTFLTES